ncbi:hypothetical protein ATG98_3513 [Marinobacter sp. LV10R520-4]|jgi:hypothetical protein|uniref:hypothetical protein n=1 Tax=Marinobacter sp. LV10R520-4 TaxID=1761796 RepID=UPI000BF2A7B1|nr:hypothetical protein [Marinobacter sp. LV10R520-4]PFG54293.1 hypothetical protein ATG98_3513 [Marinobacter sp. LV10R520-4]
MADCLVSLSDQAFFTIVTSALEAYQVDHAKLDGDPETHLETIGNLWGFINESRRGEYVYRIEMADVSTAADRDKSWVIAKNESYEYKRDFLDCYYPEFRFLGDFHSHPYSEAQNQVRTELDLERNSLYQFSKGDFQAVKEEQQGADKKDYRVGIVATVYEREDYIKRTSKHLDEGSCIRFQYKNMTIWIKAYVWAGEDYRRKSDKMVNLICPNLGFNVS